MADFDPSAFIAEKSRGFDPNAYIEAKMPKKFTPDEDTMYSPEGIPLVTPSTQGEPTGAAGTAAKVMTDITGAPIRAALSVAKPFTDVAKWAGYEEPSKALKQIDVGMKAQGPEFMGLQSPVSSIASLGGDIAGFGALAKVPGAVANAPAIGAYAAPIVNKGAALLQKLPAWGQSIVGGAGIGALGAEPDAGSAVNEGLIGGVLGGATHGVLAGAGSVLSPQMKRFKELLDQGFTKEQILKDSTLGQVIGGGYQKFENVLGDLPFTGVRDKISKGIESFKDVAGMRKDLLQGKADIAGKNLDEINIAQQAKNLENIQSKQAAELGAVNTQKAALSGQAEQAGKDLSFKNQQELAARLAELEKFHAAKEAEVFAGHETKRGALAEEEKAFHKPAVEKALSNIMDVKNIPANLRGTELINYGQKQISEGYKKAFDEIGNMRLTKNRIGELQQVINDHKDSLTPKTKKFLKNEINGLIKTSEKGGWLTPEKWQAQLSNLSTGAYKAKTSSTVEEQKYGDALQDLKDKWMDLVEGQAGSELFKQVNKAYSEFQIPQKASTYLGSLIKGGEPTPQDLLKAISSAISTKRLAGGENELQKMATEGYEKIMANRKVLQDEINKDKANLKAAKERANELYGQAKDIAARNVKMRQEAGSAKAKVQGEDAAAKLKEAQKAEDKAKDLENSLANKNIKMRKEAIQAKTDVTKKGVDTAVKEATSRPGETYGEKRALYNLAGVNALTGGSAIGLGALLGIPTAASLAGAGIAGSRLLYAKPVQDFLKKAATSERPQALKTLGTEMRTHAPLGALSTVQNYEAARERPGVQVINPETGEEINPPQGNLP